VPKPYYFHGNIIAMEFIGTDGTPSKRLKDVRLANPKETLDEILRQIKLLYSASLVHSDISEYNILMKDNKPYLIDFGQAVVLGHPESLNFLRRDISNIVNYFFKKYGIVYDSYQLVSEITFEK
jgi:RIO kinase 1